MHRVFWQAALDRRHFFCLNASQPHAGTLLGFIYCASGGTRRRGAPVRLGRLKHAVQAAPGLKDALLVHLPARRVLCRKHLPPPTERWPESDNKSLYWSRLSTSYTCEDPAEIGHSELNQMLGRWSQAIKSRLPDCCGAENSLIMSSQASLSYTLHTAPRVVLASESHALQSLCRRRDSGSDSSFMGLWSVGFWGSWAHPNVEEQGLLGAVPGAHGCSALGREPRLQRQVGRVAARMQRISCIDWGQ